MRLDYKILWFEDDEKWYNSIIPFVNDYFDEIGFELKVDRQSDASNVEKCLKENNDLILMDYNLIGTKGDSLIELVRRQQVFTEVIFYSQAGEEAVREIIKQKGVDGVYCASRDLDVFEEKIKKVVHNTIRKVQDVNNMRGLVMAETSELDYIMLDTIFDYLSLIKEEKESFENYIFNATRDSAKSNLNKCERLKSENNVHELINSPIFDTDKKRRTLCELLSRMGCLNDNKQCFESYKVEIQDLRNVLAHVKEELNDKGLKVLKSKVKGYEEVEFDDDKYIEIRKNIKKHSTNLVSIKHYIKQQKEAIDSAAAHKE